MAVAQGNHHEHHYGDLDGRLYGFVFLNGGSSVVDWYPCRPRTGWLNNMSKQWYIVHAYSGFEKKVALSVKEQALQMGLDDLIDEVLVPSEEVVEMRRGAKIKSERKFFPGYVLVKMDLILGLLLTLVPEHMAYLLVDN